MKILDDRQREKKEYLLLTLSSPSSPALLGSPNWSQLRIKDNDRWPMSRLHGVHHRDAVARAFKARGKRPHLPQIVDTRNCRVPVGCLPVWYVGTGLREGEPSEIAAIVQPAPAASGRIE